MPASTRRTLLRTGAHAAWAAPLISAATAAPAFALSGDPTLQIVEQRFWVDDSVGNGWHGVVPIVSVKNPLRVSVTPEIWFSFPTADFTGVDPSQGSRPPWPTAMNAGSLSGWTAYYLGPAVGATQVQVYLQMKTPLRGGKSAFVGSLTDFQPVFSWAFANSPVVTAIAFQVRAIGLDPVPGILTRMDPPAH